MLLPGAPGRSVIAEVEQLREHARRAVRWLCEPGAPVVVLAAGEPRQVDDGTRLSARAFGIDFECMLGSGGGSSPSLTPAEPGPLVAAYLLDGHPASALTLRGPDDAESLLGGQPPPALLLMGGGSARRRDGAPGHLDPRAVPYDDRLVTDIAEPDLSALAAPDLDLAEVLLADLPAPLAVAARLLAGRPVHAHVDSYAAPYGVANIVARWWVDD